MKWIGVAGLVWGLSVLSCKTKQFSSDVQENPDLPKAQQVPVEPKPKAVEPKAADEIVLSEPKVTPSTVAPADPKVLQLNQSCEKPVQLLSSSVKVKFAAPTETCKFGEAPNLERRQGFVQAHKIYSSVLNLPPSSEICSLSLESSPMAKVRYDDFIIFTLDDFVLFASNSEIVAKLAKINNFYVWDFAKVVGSAIENFKTPAFCVGAAERCQFPITETEGPVLFKLNYAEIAGIAKAIQGKASVPFDLIATGDNNDTDCYHSGVELSVTLNYIKKPLP